MGENTEACKTEVNITNVSKHVVRKLVHEMRLLCLVSNTHGDREQIDSFWGEGA